MKLGWILFSVGIVLACSCLWLGQREKSIEKEAMGRGFSFGYPVSVAVDITSGYNGGAFGLGLASGCCFLSAALLWRKP